jgi:hypothetical protein
VRRLAANLFLDRRVRTELVVVALLVGAFLLSTGASNFDATLSKDLRSMMYDPLSAATAALLGFVLAALAVLVALPSTERMGKLQAHPKWHLVPSAYFRASRALLAALVLCLLGLPLDSGENPWVPYEVVVVVVLSLALARVVAAVVALDQILAVAQADQKNLRPTSTQTIDPGL